MQKKKKWDKGTILLYDIACHLDAPEMNGTTFMLQSILGLVCMDLVIARLPFL